ncbi:Uncharacterized conserved protein, contains Zn finger domain [Marinactinospora thermotolerans DSM 45154]|uniref:Uncharacterized conserved protein, contains Zn finger domain n=1 Tax=Marinactinospora thermotolerans DSM 45154 TaxID=1122192 RepID=A0A1T4P605_9ACTN|nr:hypothetical protein [Marinactinospora thermotolerans]SJZ86934.1 Uncharacterized conserved protein, contains Zn finger domain [Marinactinospora thermotolerans DSM 45154]
MSRHARWSQRFTEAVTGADPLERGRFHAAGGAVTELRVRAGEVVAKVGGTAGRSHHVSLIRETLDDGTWDRICAALAGQPLFRARLLSGELPLEVERVFDLLGSALLPQGPLDLVTTCSCAGWEDPCGHVTACLGAFAARLDDDPFLLLAWLGRERRAFLGQVRQLGPAAAPVGEALPAPAPVEIGPLPDGPDFWTAPDLPPLPSTPPRPQPAVHALADPQEAAEAAEALTPLYEVLISGNPCGEGVSARGTRPRGPRGGETRGPTG